MTGSKPYSNPNPNPINVVVDLRNKETLNSFSYVHAVRPFTLRASDPSDYTLCLKKA